ncbi:hypothetical protein BU17DRAFT_49261 [Hysterangium stoloniferum]|nr:hypothetical protein BU17DRAFT_49261 [Hysterangium stoloniferum]
MTTRLKRKLDNMGVDLHSNSSRMTENFCLIGTPLPPLEKSKDTGEFVPVWKQDVRDEQGRRRLHGAFTGGFSAGYFNTVGSKEGWTPSTFTSSRAERAKKKQAKPEDFMDEEDLAELRESKKLVDTTEETDLFGGTQAELSKRGDELEKDSMATALESLLPPAKDSIGARLLKKMGWRAGQGIGPRITYEQLRARDGQPVAADEIVDEEAKKHLYAPRDTKPIAYYKKENAFGLGYVPGGGLNDMVGSRNDQVGESGPNLSGMLYPDALLAGFGLGALNEAEDDDIDVYDGMRSREHRRMAYDVGETEDDEHIALGKSKANHKAYEKSLLFQASSSSTFLDGRPIVSGFVRAEKPLIEDRWFRMPDIPKGWTSDPRRVWAMDSSGDQRDKNKLEPAKPEDHRSWMKGKSADERGSILGETPLPKAPKSVFDYLSQHDRERLQKLSSSLASGKPLPQKPPPPPPPPPIDFLHTDSRTAQAALKGFQPFTTDPAKQRRYTEYLQSQASPDAPGVKPLPGQTNEQFNKELSDYAKAALIFKPVSGAMAGRFATASTVETLGNTHHGLYKPTKEEYDKLNESKETEAKKEEESPKAHAAKMGMFGPLTREVKVWQPAKLLLKRFGVKDPYPDGVPGEESNVSLPKSDAWQAEVLKTAPDFIVPPAPSPTTVEGSSSSTAAKPKERRDLANIGMGEDEEQGKDTLTYERPAKDIFKAIFASDEEDSDEEEDSKIAEPEPDRSAVPSSEPVVKGPAFQATLASNVSQEDTLSAGKFDLATFKPTFVPRSEREERKKEKTKDKKRSKDKKKAKVVVSFDVDDGGDDTKREVREKKDRSRKRRKETDATEDNDESMWVEKPPPEAVKNLVLPVLPMEEQEVAPHLRGRKRAVDFL